MSLLRGACLCAKEVFTAEGVALFDHAKNNGDKDSIFVAVIEKRKVIVAI